MVKWNRFHVICAWSCILALCCVNMVEASKFMNDDFCDDLISGTDENSTSACSYFQPEPNFLCTIDGFNTFLLPNSRVHDGICDCCDGRDEKDSPFPVNCPNTCEDKLVVLRKEALVSYRNIQAGLRAKSEILTQFRQRKYHDVKSFDSLKQERKDMIEYLKTMKYLLYYKESAREDEMRWILLREREHHCAQGDLESCNFFHPTYLNDEEMVAHGLAPPPIEDDESEVGSVKVNRREDFAKSKRKRFVYEYTKQELENFQRSSGLQRIRATICPVHDLLPDETSRIFVRLDEYYDFMLNHGLKQQRPSTNRAERRMAPRKMRKHNTLFGRYLEDGEWGYITAAITFAELVGLTVSPVTVSYRGLSYGLEMSGLYLWDLIESASRELEKLLPEEDENNLNNKLEDVGLLKVTTRYILRYLKALCDLVLDAEVDNSPTARVLSFLDYTQYSGIMTRLDAFYENTKTLFWFIDIAYHAPIVYYEYYFLRKYQQLPPKRNACLLREAIQQCETELDRLHTQLTEENEAQSLKARSIEEALAFKRKSTQKRAASVQETRVTLDFGIDSAWEALAQQCVSSTDFGTYNYTFCLFDEIKQDGHTSMGLYRHWGLDNTAEGSMVSSGGDMPLLRQYLTRLRFQAQRQAALTAAAQANTFLSTMTSSSSMVDMQGLVHSLTVELPVTMTEYLLRQWNVSASWMDLQKELWSSSNITVVQAAGQWLRHNIPSSVHLFDSERQALIAEQLRYYYRHQFYDQGTPCPVKPSLRRTTSVTFECGSEFRITSVSEYSVCQYEMTVSVPLACDQALEKGALQRLEDLKVFGFTKK